MTTRAGVSQSETDTRNAAFWNELCGSGLARSIGIDDRTTESLRKFDEAYMAMYPYLARYVTAESLPGKKTLEIGLGYGTLGQLITSRGSQYHGLDIADGPVEMMRYRLALLGKEAAARVQTGSALDIPYPDGTFDYVYSIGCLHHTGARAAADEVCVGGVDGPPPGQLRRDRPSLLRYQRGG
jgi:SAM-dependent methyltransferase